VNQTKTYRKKLLQGVVIVGLGLSVPQILAYVASVVAARVLNRAEFGAFGTMQGITQIGQPIGLGIQAFVASQLIKKFSKDYKKILRYGLEISLVVFLVNLVLSVPLSNIFQIEYLVLVLTIGAVSPFVFVSTQLGIAQGKELYIKLALIYVMFGLGRSISAIIGLLLYPKLISVGIGFFGGTLLSALISHFVLGDGKKFWRNERIKNVSTGLFKATQALLALYVLVNVDILIARIVLTPEQSGVYAVGMLVAKIAFFMPQAITVVMFPRMGKNESAALVYAILGTLIIGFLYTLVGYFGSEFVVNAIGGAKYLELYDEVWLFAIEGSLFALLQVLLYGRIAREDISVSIILWAGTLLAIFSVWFLELNQITEVVITLIVITTFLILISSFTEFNFRRKDSSYNN
jgi:O-antigen/teichoic acid export membrane protein